MKNINDYLVWTAIITPMKSDGSVDYESFESILKTQEAAGNAITVLGSTGEALNIDEEERRQVLDFALKLKLNVPLMAGVGGINLNEQLAWIDYLNTLELDAYLLVVPLYAKPGIHGQYGWFKALLDKAAKPCMIYNVPGRTAKALEVKAVKMLINHQNFWAIKEASGSTSDFEQYANAAQGKRIMSGDDAMLPAFAELGAQGVVSVASNVWPAATKEYAAQCVKGEFQDKAIWGKAIEALFSASNPIPVKALMHELDIIQSSQVRLPLSIDDLGDIASLRQAHQSISEWLESQA